MWSKPSELINYKGYGFEISCGGSHNLTPEDALEGWQNSEKHNDVIIENGHWNTLTTMGVSIKGNYSHVWFGKEDDPDGYHITYPDAKMPVNNTKDNIVSSIRSFCYICNRR